LRHFRGSGCDCRCDRHADHLHFLRYRRHAHPQGFRGRRHRWPGQHHRRHRRWFAAGLERGVYRRLYLVSLQECRAVRDFPGHAAVSAQRPVRRSQEQGAEGLMQQRFLSSPYAGWLLLAVIMALMPLLVLNDYYYDVLTRICLTATAVVGLNLLVGYAGQVSLGHAAFYAIGAYGCAILTGHYGVTPVPALILTAVGVGGAAWLVGRPILHLRGLYLAVATLGLGVIATIVLNTETAFTGGPDGTGLPPLAVQGHELSVFGEYQLFGLTISGMAAWYALAAVTLLIAVLLALNIIDSPMGRALRALRGSEIAAQVTGVDI